MLSFLQNLFGGSSTQQQSTSTPTDMTPQAYQTLRQPLTNALQGLLTTGGPSYQGPLSAPIGQNEQTQLNSLMQQNGPNTGRSQLLDQTIGGNFLPGQPGGNPFLQDAITAAQRPTMQNLDETLNRSLVGRFLQGGQNATPQGSSAFDRAAAIATRGATQAMSDIATNMSSNAYTTERTNQQQAVQLSQQEVQTGINNLQAQALPRMIQELGIERGLAQFQQHTQNLLQILSMIGGVAAPVIANQSQSTGTTEQMNGIIPGLTKLFPGGGSAGATASGGSGGASTAALG